MAYLIFLILTAFVIFILYKMINNVISNTFELKDIDDKVTLNDLPESHNFSIAVCSGALGANENIARLYEEMCVLHPLTHKDNPNITDIVNQYQDIIHGRAADPNGINTPSRILLGKENPDYETYIHNQAKLGSFSNPLKEEVSRLKKQKKEELIRDRFFAHIVSKNIPLTVVCSMVTDAKIDSFGTEDWQNLIKAVKTYVQATNQYIVAEFVENFNEIDVLLNHEKFEQYVVFRESRVPTETIIEIIRDRITIDQAYRMLNLVDSFKYTWKKAVEEILSDDLKEEEENNLRKQYHWVV